MPAPTANDQLLKHNDFLKAIETQNQARAKAIWNTIKNQPDIRQATLAFLNTITDQDKVEWILNEVIIHSPVRSKHNISLSQMHLFSRMATEQAGGYIGLEKIMIRLGDNYFEPDFCFFRPALSRRFKPDQTIFPVPDFIVEVLSPSTRARDMGIKRVLYCAHGVREYWIVDGEGEQVYQNILRGGVYKETVYSSGMKLRSKVIKGLRLPVGALFDSSHPFKTWVSVAIHGAVEAALGASIELLDEKDQALQEKDETIQQQNQALETKDQALQEKDETIQQQNQALETKDQALQEKDETIADKDKIIEELRRRLDQKL